MPETKTVFVVMGNDFPDAVFDTEEAAERYCAEKITTVSGHRIYWRVYDFALRTEASK